MEVYIGCHPNTCLTIKATKKWALSGKHCKHMLCVNHKHNNKLEKKHLNMLVINDGAHLLRCWFTPNYIDD